MGGNQSKQRKGLFSQQKQVLQNNNKVCLLSEGDRSDGPPSSSSPLPRQPSTDHAHKRKGKYSPPTSRPISAEFNAQLNGLGSVEEAWLNRERWAEFRLYLSTIDEGQDSDGRPVVADRYAIFIVLYAQLDASERHKEPVNSRLEIFNSIVQHEEDFFGRERCLKCLDGGKRSEVLRSLKAVRNGDKQPSTTLLAIVYSSVIDKLSELLGNYLNSLKEKNKNAENGY